MAMATENGDSSEGGEWDGYSDFHTVSARIGTNVFDAIDAYARIQRAHVEDERINQRTAGEAGARILSAAMSLMVEIESQHNPDATADERSEIDRIYARWQKGDAGGLEDVEVPGEGFIKAFTRVKLRDGVPDWVYQFVVDIRRAGWELGYLKAGQYEDTDDEEFTERDAMSIIN